MHNHEAGSSDDDDDDDPKMDKALAAAVLEAVPWAGLPRW